MAIRRVTIIGCGYVGTAVGVEMVRQGQQVRATTTTASRVAELGSQGFETAVWRAGDVEALRGLVQDQDAVVLCVAPGARGADYREVYLRAVESLVASLPDTRVRRVVYTSSTRVYGQDAGEWVDEQSETSPRDENGRVLLKAEKLLLESVERLAQTESRALTATVLRLSGIYGPGRDPAERALKLAGQARDDGGEWVNLIHREDVARAIIRMLAITHQGALNLSDDRPTTRREYYDRQLARAGAVPIAWVKPTEGSPCGKRVSNRAIKELLDLQLQFPHH